MKGKRFMLKTKDFKNGEKETPPSPPARITIEVEFVLERKAERVYVCGDLNNWQPTSLRMVGKLEAGLWQKRLMLPPGRHECMFFVDGNWMHDPDASENVLNTYGSLNSVVAVQPISTLIPGYL
jgi:hypothetical protein